MGQYITTGDGTKIAVYDPNPSGRKAILLIHGWPLSHEIFEYQIPALISRGYRVVTMDLRGFGNSDMPGNGYGYDRMAGDIYEVVKMLGLWNFTLGGFSMGGSIVLRYMYLFQGYGVNRLLLFAAAAPCWTKRPGFPYGKTKEDANVLIRQAATDRARLAYDFSHKQLLYGQHSKAIKDWFYNIALSATGYATIKTGISLRDEDGRRDLKAVHVPTAVFQGNQDVVVTRELTMYQYENIPGAVLYEFAESGHGVIYDELPQFNEKLLEFLGN